MSLYPIQPSFSRGVICPEMQARVDIDQYRAGLADALNMIPMRQGGLRRRPGTMFAALAKEQLEIQQGALIPFRFDEDQAYAIEMSELFARFYALAGRVESPPGTAYQIVSPYTRAQARFVHYAQSGDTIFMTHSSVAPQKLVRTSETSWAFSAETLEDGPYLDIPTDPTTLAPSARGKIAHSAVGASSADGAHPAADAVDNDPGTYWMANATGGGQALQLTFAAQRRITGYALGADYDSGGLAQPRSWRVEGSDDGVTWTVLHTASGETGWSEGERRYYSFVNTQSFLYYRIFIIDLNDTPGTPLAVRIADFAVQGAGADAQSVTLTATSTLGINGGAGFAATDVGRHIRVFSEDAYWHWAVITGWTSTTVVTISLQSPPFPSTSRSGTWRLGAFSATTGYPAFVAFYQDRKFFGCTGAQPGTVWGSRTGSYSDFSTSIPSQDDDAVTLSLPEGRIRWLAELETLVIGTDSAVRSLGPADRSKGFSASNFAFGKPYYAGTDVKRPVRCGDTLLASGNFGKSLREVQTAEGMPGYVAPDISVLSEHLLKAGLVWLAYAQSPGGLVWGGLADGTLVSVTYEREQETFAFAPHALAPSAAGAAFVEWGCVIPGSGRHELWLMVWRDGIGRTIERMAQDFRYLPAEDAYLVDCGLTYDPFPAVPATTVSGWDHLEGQTVAILADGAYEEPAVVTSGDVTLASGEAAETIHAGLEYRSWGRTLRISEGSPDGTALGRKKIVRGVIIDVLETLICRVRSYLSANWERVNLRSFADPLGTVQPLATGASKAATDSSWENSGGQIEFESVGATPLTIRAIIPAVEGEP